jgi:porphobilinogen synthase
MIKNASDDEFIDYKPSVLESLSCIKRAGADVIFSYFSREVAEWLK